MVPPVDVQSRIAETLSAYDDLIEVNQRRIAILEGMARRLFDEWFVRLRYPGHEDAELVETELGIARQGCRCVALQEFAEVIGRSIKPEDHPHTSFCHYSLPNFDNQQTATIDPSFEIRSNKIKIEKDTVLLSKLNPRFPRVWAVTEQSQNPMVCSTEFVPLRARHGHLFVLKELLLSGLFRGFITGLAGGTSTSHQRVRPGEILQFRFISPPEQVIAELEQHLRPLNAKAIIARQQNRKLRAARDLLLPKLISGEIDVSTAEETFPEAAE
jgi:type I restriction enzyme S subunit